MLRFGFGISGLLELRSVTSCDNSSSLLRSRVTRWPSYIISLLFINNDNFSFVAFRVGLVVLVSNSLWSSYSLMNHLTYDKVNDIDPFIFIRRIPMHQTFVLFVPSLYLLEIYNFYYFSYLAILKFILGWGSRFLSSQI